MARFKDIRAGLATPAEGQCSPTRSNTKSNWYSERLTFAKSLRVLRSQLLNMCARSAIKES